MATRTPEVARYHQTIVSAAPINGDGVTAALLPYVEQYTVYIHAATAVKVHVLLSPDEGVTYFELSESPLIMGADVDAALQMDFDASHIKLVGDTAADVTCIVRGRVE
jgi:hypothetical protein